MGIPQTPNDKSTTSNSRSKPPIPKRSHAFKRQLKELQILHLWQMSQADKHKTSEVTPEAFYSQVRPADHSRALFFGVIPAQVPAPKSRLIRLRRISFRESVSLIRGWRLQFRQHSLRIQKALIDGNDLVHVSGSPLVDIQAAVTDDSYHVVDSSEVAFKPASFIAFQNASSKHLAGVFPAGKYFCGNLVC